jgi:anthranilate phosphoribosyltransferase
LAKLLDPCRGASVRVVAVTHPAFMDSLETLLRAEKATALLMRGTEGEAYVAPRRRPRLLGLHGGEAEVLFEQEVFTSDVGTEAETLAENEPCSVTVNTALIQGMLAGTIPVPQAILDQVAALERLARQD